MPDPKTHDISYKHLKSRLNEDTLSSLPNYDDYNVFAQGHDFLIYHDFYKIWNQKGLDNNVHNSVLLQEHSFQEFIYNYMKTARENGSIEEEQTRLFIGPGYIMHHILDSYVHPQIIYYSGSHERNPRETTWQHGIVENLLDIYMMEKFENKNTSNYKVHKDFYIGKQKISIKLIKTLDDSLKKTYGIINGGKLFNKAFSQIYYFMKSYKYDPTGLKRKLFDHLNPYLVGTSSFSYHRDCNDVIPYLNLNHDEWLNPLDSSIKSNASLLELYETALDEGAHIINNLEKICKNGVFNKDDIYSIIPDKASTHGLECGQKCKINNKGSWFCAT